MTNYDRDMEPASLASGFSCSKIHPRFSRLSCPFIANVIRIPVQRCVPLFWSYLVLFGAIWRDLVLKTLSTFSHGSCLKTQSTGKMGDCMSFAALLHTARIRSPFMHLCAVTCGYMHLYAQKRKSSELLHQPHTTAIG